MVDDGVELLGEEGSAGGSFTVDVEMGEVMGFEGDEGAGIDVDETLVEDDTEVEIEGPDPNGKDDDTDADDNNMDGDDNGADAGTDDMDADDQNKDADDYNMDADEHNMDDEDHNMDADDQGNDDGEYKPESSEEGDVRTAGWSEEMLQTEEMMRVGLCVNTVARVAVCLGCRSVVKPSDLYTHISKAHSISTSLEFCRRLQEEHNLQPDPYHSRPGSVIKAIYGLDVLEGYLACDLCGYACEWEKSMERHIKKTEECRTYRTRFAQTFRPSSKQMYFGVEFGPVEEDIEDPLDPVFYLRKKFAPMPYSNIPIKSPGSTQDANHFLRLEKWHLYVEGKTGLQITHAVREREPELREEVRICVERFTDRVVEKLNAVDHQPRAAIGDYQG